MLKKMREERAKLINQMRSIVDKDSMSEEDEELYNRLDKEQALLGKKIEAAEKQEQLEAELSVIDEEIEKQPISSSHKENPLDTKKYSDIYAQYLRLGSNDLSNEILNELKRSPGPKGGYLVPTEFERKLIVALERSNQLRKYCNIISVGGDREVPVADSVGEAHWIAEGAAYPTTDPSFSGGKLAPNKVGRIILVSEELVADNAVDLESYLINALSQSIGIAEEIGFCWGTGSGQPESLFGEGAQKTSSTSGKISADEIIDTYYALSPMYRSRATFCVTDRAIADIRKLKDQNGQYLWQPSLAAGSPDMLMGRPVIEVPDRPGSTRKNGEQALSFCDLSYYMIGDRYNSTAIQRMDERYAEVGKIGFRAHRRTDGAVALPSAFSRLKYKA